MGAAALTMTTTTPNLKDQATGLRQLFSASTLPVHLLTCPSRASLTIPLSQRLSYELADRGHMVAWIDEIDLVEREDWPLPSHLRFDLGQALDGHVDMSAAMHAIKPQLLYGLSCKTRRLGSVERTLQDRLLASGVRFETVIIAAHPAVQPAQYAQMVHHTVISGTDDQSLRNTFQWMLKIEALHAPRSWSVVLSGSEKRTQTAFRWLEDASAAHLSQPVKLLGSVPLKTLTAPLAHTWSGQLELMEVMLQHLVAY